MLLRYHVDDPVFFDSDCRVTLQNMVRISGAKLKELAARGAKFQIVTVAKETGIVNLLEMDEPWAIDDPRIGESWTNFWRQDDFSATAYFYLDSPTNGLPALQSLEERLRGPLNELISEEFTDSQEDGKTGRLFSGKPQNLPVFPVFLFSPLKQRSMGTLAK